MVRVFLVRTRLEPARQPVGPRAGVAVRASGELQRREDLDRRQQQPRRGGKREQRPTIASTMLEPFSVAFTLRESRLRGRKRLRSRRHRMAA